MRRRPFLHSLPAMAAAPWATQAAGAAGAKTELKDGVLSIVLPKADESRRRHVAIKAVS